jgi:hypothetical protein
MPGCFMEVEKSSNLIMTRKLVKVGYFKKLFQYKRYRDKVRDL